MMYLRGVHLDVVDPHLPHQTPQVGPHRQLVVAEDLQHALHVQKA